MPDPARTSSPRRYQSSGSPDLSPVWYGPPYKITIYIRDHMAYSDAIRVSTLPSGEMALVVPIKPVTEDTVSGACWNQWKYWGSRNASDLQAACSEMDSFFVCTVEDDEYRWKLACLFAEMRRQEAVPRVLDTYVVANITGILSASLIHAQWRILRAIIPLWGRSARKSVAVNRMS